MDREFFEKKAIETCEKISKKIDTMELSDVIAEAFTEGYFAGYEAAEREFLGAAYAIVEGKRGSEEDD